MENIIFALIFMFAMAITPGPNNIMIMSSGLNHGFNKSNPHLWGIVVGFAILTLCVGFGLNTIFAKFNWIQQIVKILGVIYTCYLAYKIAITDKQSQFKKKPLTFIQAALFQWVNIKAWVAIISAISIYLTPENMLLQILLLTTGNILISIISASTWLFFGLWLQKIINNPKHLKLFNKIMAVLLVISILPVIIL